MTTTLIAPVALAPAAPRSRIAGAPFDFRTAADRASFEQACRKLESPARDAREWAKNFAALDEALVEGVARIKPALLGSATCWNHAERAIAEWIQLRHFQLAEVAGGIAAAAVCKPGGEAERDLRLGMHTLRNLSEAAKWQMMVFATRARSERPDSPVAQ
jgi:predicted transcriptional regulator